MSGSTPPTISPDARAALTTLATHTSGSGEDKRQTLTDNAIINLCLVLLDEKPLAEVAFSMLPDEWTSITENEVCDRIATLGIHSQTRVALERTDDPYLVVSVDVAPTQKEYNERLTPQPALEIGRRNGQIYGYPTDAIDAFVEFYAEGNETYAIAQSDYEWTLLEHGDITAAELAYQEFINWVPPMTTEALASAIDEGQRRYELLLAFTQENDLPVVAKRIRGAYERSRFDYENGNPPTWLGEEADDAEASEE